MEKPVEIEGTADFSALAVEIWQEFKLLDIQEVWDNSGSTRYGYVDPYELACEMLEEILEPYMDEWKELTEPSEKQAYAKELIKAIEQFKASDLEFKDWAVNTIDEIIAELKSSANI